MKAHLAKVSLGLLSAAFLHGCQEQGSSPVGPEGLGPEFDKPNNESCPPGVELVNGHCHGDANVEDKTVTVRLTGAMGGEATRLNVFSDNNKKFSMNTGGQSTGEIRMNFQKLQCSEEVPPHIDASDAATRVTRLESQLTTTVKVSDSSFDLFFVKVDRTTETADKNNDFQVTYDPDGLGGVILGWAHRSPPSVSETPAEVFAFTGGEIRVGEDEGRSKDRIRILCSGAPAVTVMVK